MAAKMHNQIDEETKQRRADHIMELQAEVSAEREEQRRSATPMSASATASTMRPACTCCAPRLTALKLTAMC